MEGLHGMNLSGMKVELGGRVTYDVTHGVFATQFPKAPATSASRPSTISHPDASTESKPFSTHLFESGPGTRDSFRQSTESASMVHDIAAAAMGTFKLVPPGRGPAASADG